MPPRFFVIDSLGLFLLMLSTGYDLQIHVTEHLYRTFPPQSCHLRYSGLCSLFSSFSISTILGWCCVFTVSLTDFLVTCDKALSSISTLYCRCLVCATDGGAVLRKFRKRQKLTDMGRKSEKCPSKIFLY